MLVVLVPIGLATLVGLGVLWPGSEKSAAQQAAESFLPPGTTYPQATIASLKLGPCAAATPAQTCGTAGMTIDEGPAAGDFVQVDLSPDVVSEGVAVGDELVLQADPAADGGAVTYS